MRFTCEKMQLQAGIAVASRAAAGKSPIPSLEGLLIKAGEKLSITGYDLKKGIYTSLEADIQQIGSIVVNARLFGEMIRKLPDGMVTISADESYNVSVKCGRSQFNFIGIAPQDYPELPEIDPVNNISLPQNILASMIRETSFAVADNDVRPIYTGALMEIEADQLTMVAVDGYRLAKRVEKLESARMEDCSFVVPGNALNDVERICGDGEELVKISVGAKHISFSLGETVVISRRLEGEFLNYRRSIPESFKYSIKVDRSELMSVIDRVSLIVTERNSSPVRMSFGQDSIDCLCLTPIGRAQDICSCQGDGEGMQIGFNDRYLKEALKNAGAEELELCLNGPASPCVVRAADGSENFTYMILPVRLHA